MPVKLGEFQPKSLKPTRVVWSSSYAAILKLVLTSLVFRRNFDKIYYLNVGFRKKKEFHEN
jgi:hypothetical protein